MSEIVTDYKGNRARQVEPSHFTGVPSKMRLTLTGCQLNVGLNFKNLHYVKQMLHLESLEHNMWAI